MNSADYKVMQTLASPRDILDSILTARRVDEQARLAEKMGAGGALRNQRYSMEQVTQMELAEKLRPEQAIMNMMDFNRDAAEERRLGRKRTSAFDDLIAAKVASTVGPLYASESGPKLDVLSSDPFSPADAVTRMQPRISKQAITTLEAAGFSMELFTNPSTDPLTMLFNQMSEPANNTPNLKSSARELDRKVALESFRRRGYY